MKIIFSLFLFFSAINLPAQDLNNDSIETKKESKTEQLFRNRWIQSTYIGVPLITAGLIEMHENKRFRSLHDDFLKTFNTDVDNYLQYSPLAVMVALKSCGVESKSSWKKMITADVASVMLMATITRTIKPLGHELRPDGSDYHSFPSGHTGTAFMCATMLNEEYGQYSPWIGIGAYSVATATGVMRMMNNRHWMSDVLAGAGIGIISTEFGYWVADLLNPKSPRSYNPHSVDINDDGKNPSFFGLYAGFIVPLGNYEPAPNTSLSAATGGVFGFEGAYFFNKHYGIGGLTALSDITYEVDRKEQNRIDDTSHSYIAQVGLYTHYPLYERLYIGGKLLGGVAYYPTTNGEIIQIPSKGGACATCGLNLGIRTKQHLDFKIGCDYNLMPSHSKSSGRNIHALTLSGSTAVKF